ncbi:MAG: tRNA (adenosine(37)-N6)-threonylcarbamoyltransferase complex dimerization subunit type 1 TsaB [Bacteroidota bacterium]|nr:tRNA (adenosine(37)-N6)-threonylcarbamoyltransferase complex dimerization subunit type 1 TsaB [Candidatus Kapabacteria bacterium]MDW8219591.1 tRNA (adenosine(37)-N6)-threonylcarbamoyltransferase complex dimerization subunit type 1 TsaB [Bacteroidota bacterium]
MEYQPSSHILLCIETSSSLCGVAIADIPSRTLVAELSLLEPFLHDKLLAEATRSLLQLYGFSLNDVAVVAVSAGPGSFTGLRIGAAFAKALCFDNTPKLLPISTTEALAYAAAPYARLLAKTHICVGISSHKHVVYLQHFLLEETSLTAEDTLHLTEQIPQQPHPTTLYVGSAFQGISTFHALPELAYTTSRMIAMRALVLLDTQEFVLPEDFIPYYGQEFIPKTLSIAPKT